MFLHLGKDYVIPLKEVISIIDSNSLESKDTLDFLRVSEEEGFLVKIVDEDIKSYIITEKIEKDIKRNKNIRKSIIYCTNISSNTLWKRSNYLKTISTNI